MAFVEVIPKGPYCIKIKLKVISINPHFKYFFPPYLINIVVVWPEVQNIPYIPAKFSFKNSMDDVFSHLVMGGADIIDGHTFSSKVVTDWNDVMDFPPPKNLNFWGNSSILEPFSKNIMLPSSSVKTDFLSP